jgi:hypothetical protein
MLKLVIFYRAQSFYNLVIHFAITNLAILATVFSHFSELSHSAIVNSSIYYSA